MLEVLFLIDNQLLNRIFWCFLILSVSYYFLLILVERCSQSQKITPFKRKPTTRFIWSICYYLSSTMFLLYYHYYFVRPEVEKEGGGRYFPQYENLLFFLSSNRNNFKNIFVVSISFHSLGSLQLIREAEVADAITRVLYTVILSFLYYLSYEHYFLMLNIVIGLYQALTHSLFFVALHTKPAKDLVFNGCAVVHFVSWSYVFLALLPFNYLLPTLYMKPFNVWLNIFCWMWYGSCVWNSPILQVLYHQTFHTATPEDSLSCLGGGRVAQCLLLKETKETRHLKQLHKAVEELKEAHIRSHSLSNGDNSRSESQSARALQTLKCVMTLKRKLKRIRETKAAATMTPAELGRDNEDREENVIQGNKDRNGGTSQVAK